MATLSSWDYKAAHVDSAIDYANFLSTARIMLYAASVTETTTGAGVTYSAGNFVPIGVVQGFNFSDQRPVEYIFEMGSEIPYLVPGRSQGQLNISRVLINGKDLANILYHGIDNNGTSSIPASNVIKALKDVSRPFDLMFAAFSNPQGSDRAVPIFSRTFRNCWITARSESYTANQTIVAENATISYQDMFSVTIGGTTAIV